MDIPLYQYSTFCLCLILVTAFISAAKKAFSVLDRRGAETLERGRECVALRFLTDRPAETLLTLLILHSGVLIALVLITLVTFSQFWLTTGVLIILMIVYLYLGRVLPRALIQGRELPFIQRASIVLKILYYGLAPLRLPLEWVSALLLPAGTGLEMPFIRDRDFKNLFAGYRRGDEETYERAMIHNVMEFRETRVKEVMTPRPDMFCIDIETDLAGVLESVQNCVFSRVPVYRDDLDHIVGILYVKDLLPLLLQKVGLDRKLLTTLLHPALHVPETKRVSELLRDFKKQNVHIAIVVDEYGGVEGLVSLEDLLEEIVGEIQDEDDVEEQPVVQISERTFRVSAMLSPEEFNEFFDCAIESEDYETIGGFVLDQLGRFPKWGEKVRYGNLEIVVYRSKGVRILEVLVNRREEISDLAENAGEDH
ncbi:MAG: hemolysin family protein [bacterium]|nr:hemolysin family protein [bacterium]